MFRRNDEKFLTTAGARLNGPRRSSGVAEIAGQVNWLLMAGFVVVLGAALYATGMPAYVGVATFIFVLVGWLFSLTLHEFSHAAVAFLVGDRSYSTRRYLSGNPLHYINPLLSIVLPLLFVLIGGIGLPGGAVILQTANIRERWRHSAISLAGPAANLVVLLLLAVVYRISMAVPALGTTAAAAVAFLAFLQGTAIVLNLIPIPGLDGYGVIEPYLSYQTRQTFESIRPYGFIIIFVLFLWVPLFNQIFFGIVTQGVGLLGFDPIMVFSGLANFRFWIH